MKQLLRSTTAYRAILREEFQSALVLFPDGKYLRALLKECAKAFFGAKDGSRAAELIDKESFADCIFCPAAGERLTAEDCAAILEESLLAPVETGKKLFVLDRFDASSALVQNKFLKILEEPPVGAHFLLGAEAEFSVLPTVLSRVKKYALSPFPEEEIEGALRREYPGRDVSQAAGASGGIYSVGESLLLGGGEEFALARQFLSFEGTETLCRAMGERKDRKEFFAALKSLLRDMLMTAAGQGRYAHSRDLPEGFAAGAIVKALERVGEAEKQIQFNANYASCLYALAIDIKEEKEKWQRLS